MATIALRADLEQSLLIQAQESNKSLNELVNEAVESYLLQQQEKKLDQEITAYEKLHPQLRETHLGHWVAIHQQKLVDSDQDRMALFRRVQTSYGETTILIRQVGPQPVEEIWVRTPSTGKIKE